MSRRRKYIYGKKNRKTLQIIITCLMAVLALAAIATSVLLLYQNISSRTAKQNSSSLSQPSSASSENSNAAQTQSSSASSQADKDESKHVTLLAVGDNLIHNTIYFQAAARANYQGYDFNFVYEKVASMIRAADVAMVNQETVLASKVKPLSNYPRFNSPTEVGDALINAGFDVVNHANNHMFDQGDAGMVATLDYWDTKPDVTVVGVYRTPEDILKIQTRTVNGVKIAFLGLTVVNNGLAFSSGSSLRYIDGNNTEMVKQIIQNAKAQADVVVVNAHWGTEGSQQVSSAQKNLAQAMADDGADIIIGHHPHVLQSMEYITASDGRKVFVAYSMGNFVSAQTSACNMVGGMVEVGITKSSTQAKTEISSVVFRPTITHYGSNLANVQIYPFKQYTPELASSHGVKAYDGKFSYDYIKQCFSVVPEEFLEK